MKKISVIYTIYGNFDAGRLQLAILSALEQDYENKEIVVVENNLKKSFVPLDKRIKHIFLRGSKKGFSEMRNIGIKNSTGDLIYLNDADIIFLDRRFLSELEREYKKDNSALIRPPKLRLLEKDYVAFSKMAKKNFNKALVSLHKNKYLASIDGKFPRLYYLKHLNTGFTAQRLNSNVHEVFNWDVDIHYGGIFASKSQLRKVSYYSPGYIHWGNEDGDLQWKLASFGKLRKIPKRKIFTVLHLDHKRGYVDIKKYNLSEAIFQYRIGLGYKKAIELDKKNFKDYQSVLSSWEDASNNLYWKKFRKLVENQKYKIV